MGSSAFPASRRLSRSFFVRGAEELARDLLGCALVGKESGTTLAVRLVEVEAYLGEGVDPASHAFRGKTKRNAEMFATPGRLYVYFTYGMHYCMNVVAEPKGVAGAVLLRAGEPLSSEDLMKRRRGRIGLQLTNGPAKLCQALGIGSKHNGLDLVRGPWGIWRLDHPRTIASSPRIGIQKGRQFPWRFYDADSPYVSRPSR